ncbi:AMP-binding protein [Streptomyces sp. FxanaA7]|uniref:AMP-binding protein n=1 Tax=Streptomyces sp. FxanaA7 TaxID=1265492 RepID=UPI0005F06747|nr:AMP-binding protein [Streptomyces sp. FxanaA7]
MTVYNLGSLLEKSATLFPDREAIVFGRQHITYAELDQLANQCAHVVVEAGIVPGDKVALTCPNVPFFTVAYFGILKAGATVVPLNVLLKSREIVYHLEDSDAKAYLCFEGSDALPTGASGAEAFQQVESCQRMFTITADPIADSSIEGAEPLGRLP